MADASDGYLYGSTQTGGSLGGGVVFRMSPKGVYKILHEFKFSTEDQTTSWSPSGVTISRNGQIWGVTQYRGFFGGDGTVFKIGPKGILTTVHTFPADGSEGLEPTATLTQGSDGWLYGTTSTGGAGASQGTIFRVNSNAQFEILHVFSSFEGNHGSARLLEVRPGVFYGIQPYGGAAELGIIYEIDSDGTFRTLHEFRESDGISGVTSGLVFGKDGLIYGTSDFSTRGGLGGSIFRVSSDGSSVKALYFFRDDRFDTRSPCARPLVDRLAVADDGALVGECNMGGFEADSEVPGYGKGAVFKYYPAAE